MDVKTHLVECRRVLEGALQPSPDNTDEKVRDDLGTVLWHVKTAHAKMAVGDAAAWDRYFCAALAGATAAPFLHDGAGGHDAAEWAAGVADSALAERAKRGL